MKWYTYALLVISVWVFATWVIINMPSGPAAVTAAPTPEPTLVVMGETYTEAQNIERVAASIERYGFTAICVRHVTFIGQIAIPARGFERDGFRALAWYAAACTDYLERGEGDE